MHTLLEVAVGLYVGVTIGQLQNLNRRLKKLLNEIDKLRS